MKAITFKSKAAALQASRDLYKQSRPDDINTDDVTKYAYGVEEQEDGSYAMLVPPESKLHVREKDTKGSNELTGEEVIAQYAAKDVKEYVPRVKG